MNKEEKYKEAFDKYEFRRKLYPSKVLINPEEVKQRLKEGFKEKRCHEAHDLIAYEEAILTIKRIEEQGIVKEAVQKAIERHSERDEAYCQYWVHMLKNKTWEEIKAILVDLSDYGQHWRQCNPFFGYISNKEHMEIFAKYNPKMKPILEKRKKEGLI
jgi:hypothetical protein